MLPAPAVLPVARSHAPRGIAAAWEHAALSLTLLLAAAQLFQFLTANLALLVHITDEWPRAVVENAHLQPDRVSEGAFFHLAVKHAVATSHDGSSDVEAADIRSVELPL